LGALAMLAPDLAPRLRGIERADSLAFDLHKWGQAPYDAGFVLVRDGVLHRNAFATAPAYLRRESRGLAAGSPWFCDYGPDLSRGFRALKTWFLFKVYGAEALGAVVSRCCALAHYLERSIAASPELELLAPVDLNVVCFRYRADHAQRVNSQIVVELQESGVVAPSTTVIDGQFAIRAAIVNHRTGRADIDNLVEKTLALGRAIVGPPATGVPEPQPVPDQPPCLASESARGDLESRIAPDEAASDLRFDRAALDPARSGVPNPQPIPDRPTRRASESALGNIEPRTAPDEAASDLRFDRAIVDPAAGVSKPQPPADPPPRLVRESALRDLESRIAPDAAALDLRFDRACLLTEMGRTAEARDAFLDLLARDPSHRLALNNLGTLLYSTGYRSAARTAYAEAVARHPQDPMSRVNLGNLLYEGGDFASARDHFEAALRADPAHFEAHRGLAYVLAELGDEEAAAHHRRKAFEDRPLLALPYRGDGPPISLLLLVSSLGGNIPTRNFLDDRVFQTFVLVPEFYDPRVPLPPHQIVFNAIGDADLAASSLAAAQAVLACTSAPVINPPSAVLGTGRADHGRLARVPGVVVPATVTLPRDSLAAPEAAATLDRLGLRFPLLVRTPGFHTGRHFLRVESAAALPAALAELPGKNLTVIEFLDARAADGKVRKFRVMMIGGNLYPLHVAISSNWKVHYFTADMADRPDHRSEDARFLDDMPGVLGPAAMQALARIQATLGLDYAGIDFGLSDSGELLLFEANATMVVNPPEPDPRWTYRRPAVDRIFAAVRQLLIRHPRETQVPSA